MALTNLWKFGKEIAGLPLLDHPKNEGAKALTAI
jgi:hypothetical protein